MKSAVLVIDVQNILFDPTPQPFERNEVLTRINKVTDWARQKDISVIFIQHEQTGTPIEYGSEGWQLQSSLHVESSDHFIRKTTPDSFYEQTWSRCCKNSVLSIFISAATPQSFV